MSYRESWLLRRYVVSFTTVSFSRLCIKSAQNEVIEKKMQFIMPKAKDAFNIEHALLALTEKGV